MSKKDWLYVPLALIGAFVCFAFTHDFGLAFGLFAGMLSGYFSGKLSASA